MADELRNQSKELKQISENIKELSKNLKTQFDKLGSRFGKEVTDIMTPEIQQLHSVFSDMYGVTKESSKSTLKFFGKGLTDDAKMLIATETSAKELDNISETLRGTGAKAKIGKGLKVQNKGLDKLMKDNNKIAKDQLDINKREERKKRGMFKVKKNWLLDLLELLIGVPLFIIGAALGTAVAFLLQPFIVIGKVFKAAYSLLQGQLILDSLKMLGKLFSGIIKFVFSPATVRLLDRIPYLGRFIFKLFKPLFSLISMGELSFIGKTAKILGKGFKFIGSIFGLIGKMIGVVLKFPGLRFLARGFMAGFSKIFWPLQIIISIIDFVKGFMKTEGTIMDKIQGGIKNVIVQFFKWPLELLGKIWEWIQVKIFRKNPEDIEEGKAAQKMIEWLGKGVDMIFEGWKLIFGLLGDGLEWINEKIAPFIDWVKGSSWENTKAAVVKWLSDIFYLPQSLREWIMKVFDIKEMPEELPSEEETLKLKREEERKRLRTGNWVMDDNGELQYIPPRQERMSVAQMAAENRAALQAKREAELAVAMAQGEKEKDLLNEYKKVGDAVQKSTDKSVVPIAIPGDQGGKIPPDHTTDIQTSTIWALSPGL